LTARKTYKPAQQAENGLDFVMTNEEILIKSRRETLLREARALAENPNASKADLKLADVKLAEASSLKTNHERQLRVAQAMGTSAPEMLSDAQITRQRESQELRNYLAFGKKEVRTYSGMNVVTDASGGFFVPQTFYDSVTFALKQADGLWDDSVITLWEDEHGNAATFPLIDDTGTVAVQVGEGQSSIEAELGVIDKLTIPKPAFWRSKKLITSVELLQDSAFPVEDYVSKAVANRFQRGISAANVSTLISQTVSGATSVTSNSVQLDDILNLLSSVNPAWLNQPKTFFGMNFSTMVGLLKLKDAQARYLWNPRFDANGRPLLFNIPVILLPSLPSAASLAAGTVVLGDFSMAVRRTVKNSMKLMRYVQADNLAENGLVAYEGFLRTSFGVLTNSNITSPPIKFLTQAA
jgi:HK97 family phage major capsid protein